MSEWKPKRFWTAARVAPAEGGYTVLLDGRAIRTPAKAPLVVPTEALAQEIAAEWEAQDEVVDPCAMPFTRSANAAIDKVAVQFDEVADLIAAYGDCDLLCYRATDPAALIARQAAGWDSILKWARTTHDIDLKTFSGVIHGDQPPETLSRIVARTRAMSAFELTAFHDLVGLSGSFLLGLAAAEAVEPAEAVWDLSRIDEDWQIEQWGHDDEAAEMAALKRAAFLHAARLFALVAGQG